MAAPSKGPRLGSSPAHERLMLANLATSLFEHGRIRTTEAKAKRLRPFAERLITKARVGDLHNRREVMKVVRDKDVVHKLFAEIGPHFASRPGGYTRIVKTMPRKGDNAPMAIIELITERTATAEAEQARRSRFRGDQRRSAAPAPGVAVDEETVSDPTEAAEAATPVVESPAATVPQEAEETAEQADLAKEKDEP